MAKAKQTTETIEVQTERRVFSPQQVADYVGITRSHVYNLVARDEFPHPFKIGRRTFWTRDIVDKFLNDRMAEANRGMTA